MAQLITVRLSRHDAQPWGFRLQGGKDFGTPLVVQKVNGGSIADQAGLVPGDAVIKVNNIDVFNLRHKDAQDIVVRSGNSFELQIQRGGSTWRPHVVPTGSVPSPSSYLPNNVPTVTRTSLSHKQPEVHHIGSGYNNAARPFNSVNGSDGQVKSIVNKQYNTPVGIYSEEAIAETLSAQAEVLAGGVLGVNFKKNEKIYNAANSEVLKMLHEQENDQPEPASQAPGNFFWTASHAIGRPRDVQPSHEDERIGTPLQQNTLAPSALHRPSLPTRMAPSQAAPQEEQSESALPPMQPYHPPPQHPLQQQKEEIVSAKPSNHPLCDSCGVSIIGVFVRIKDKNLHAECFKCATCGTSLKNQGYFNFNNKLYCDIHARLAAMNNPPKGTEGHFPVPIKPTQKLSANTISAALEQHSQYNGSSNINSGYGGPKPFNNSPLSPPLSGPRSPSTYPPPTTQQNWGQPKPATNPYATLPRTGGQSQDTPHELTPSAPSPYYDIQATSTASSNIDSAIYNATVVSESKTSNAPLLVTDNTGPVTMAFQSLDLHDDHSQAHPRPFTPSLINKPAPIIPNYQQPERLITEECSARQSHLFDPRTASPLPDRSRSPAPGPPPNPLNSIRAPRIKTQEDIGYRPTQAGSITTGQSYYGTQAAQYQQQQQGQLVSHYETSAQSGAQSFMEKPEIVQKRQFGDMTVQTRAKESQMSEGQHSQLQSKTTTQVGNMQIERHRKVVEEFEHTQSAKSIEILKTSGDTRQIGNTGFVANQARRLSGLEQDISSITDQSQAISARASTLGQIDSTFPQYKSPEPVATFPIKTVLPSYTEPQRPSYVFPPDASNTLVDAPSSYKEQQSTFMASSASSYAASSAQSTAAAQSSLTSASKLNTTIPVPALKAPMQFGSGGGSSDIKPMFSQPSSQQLTNAYKPSPSNGPAGFKPPPPPPSNIIPSVVNDPSPASAGPNKGGAFGATSAPKRGRGILNKAVGPGGRVPLCGCCNSQIRGPFITALGRIWCPDHFVCVNANCRRPLQDIGFVEEKGDLYCEYCFEKYLAPTCSKCSSKIKGDCLNAIGKHYHPECFTCSYCGKLFGNSPFFLEEGEPYCEADWNELFTTKCFACGFPVEAGDRWVEALNHNYHSQCFNCTMCKKNLEGQSFYNKGGRPFCKNHAR